MDHKPPPLKHLGQHYLHAKNIIDMIVQTINPISKSVFEIGPGAGAITLELFKISNTLGQEFLACDIDKRSIEYLEQSIPSQHLICDDFLKNSNAILENLPSPIHIISNLPYNIGTPIFTKLLQIPNVTTMTLMHQKEVAIKLMPESSMSSLKALSLIHGTCYKLALVKPGHFNPPPKVDSLVFVFERYPNPLLKAAHWQGYEEYLRKIFGSPRKQLGGILKRYWPWMDYKGNKLDRAETLNLAQVLEIFHLILEHDESL